MEEMAEERTGIDAGTPKKTPPDVCESDLRLPVIDPPGGCVIFVRDDVIEGRLNGFQIQLPGAPGAPRSRLCDESRIFQLNLIVLNAQHTGNIPEPHHIGRRGRVDLIVRFFVLIERQALIVVPTHCPVAEIRVTAVGGHLGQIVRPQIIGFTGMDRVIAPRGKKPH